jgi:hypothetical protein
MSASWPMTQPEIRVDNGAVAIGAGVEIGHQFSSRVPDVRFAPKIGAGAVV